MLRVDIGVVPGSCSLSKYDIARRHASPTTANDVTGVVIEYDQPRCSMNQTTRLEETKNCPQACRHADFVRGSSQIKPVLHPRKSAFIRVICGPFFVYRVAPALCRMFAEALRVLEALWFSLTVPDSQSFLTTPNATFAPTL
jgi:hypothetical protein